MVNIYTSDDKVPSNLRIVENVEMEFRMQIESVEGIYSNPKFIGEIQDRLLVLIEEMDERIGYNLVTPFGPTLITQISSGCKGALLAATYPEYCISNLEMGENVVPALLKVAASDSSLEINILADNYIDTYGEQEVTLDGESMTISKASIRVNEYLGY